MALLLPTVLLFGLAPAVSLSRVRIGPALARGGRQPGSSLTRRGGQALIAADVALAVVLVAAAGLMLRSFARLSAVDLGFNPDGLITMEVLPLEREPRRARGLLHGPRRAPADHAGGGLGGARGLLPAR